MSALKPIKRLFVANRGEIAVRIVHACRTLDIEAVVGVSTADRETLAAKLADRVVCIGPAQASESYLRSEIIITAAKGTGCDAVHPGYGFLAERPELQRLCAQNAIIFVGPSADAIDAMGDKLQARRIAQQLGIPTVPGSDRVASAAAALDFGRQLGYPFLLKASAGGGGRGMRIVRSPGEVAAAFAGAAADAHAAFGDSTMYIERYIEHARHVEIQVISDGSGQVVHLGDRDCSTQRRHQKLIEEAPSPVVDEMQCGRMAAAATQLASHVGYLNAGTVEFIVPQGSREFYFLEMNTRIQVEHPVTEMITGVDLVAEQIRVAGGAPLSFRQSDIVLKGHAIECRINAETPEEDFMPSPGRITHWNPPSGAGVRVDSHCYEGYSVPSYYDSMVAKLIVHGPDRAAAIAGMFTALKSFGLKGINSTIPFHQRVLAHPDFAQNRVSTRWVEEILMKQQSLAGGSSA